MKTPFFHPVINSALAARGITPRHVTDFDSSTIMQAALAAFLRGNDYSVGARSPIGRALARSLLSCAPKTCRARLYQVGARVDAIPASSLQDFRPETVSRWIVRRYPRRRYPLVLIGSSNGAAIHLAASLRAPWLPQNQLLLVRWRDLDPDDPMQSLDAGKRVADSLLAAAPDLQLHQMQDPVQDRLMSREALYFRLKRLRLGATYERFLLSHLEPGGTILLVDCAYSWPCIDVGERHIFQFGGLGALSPSDYYDDSSRARAFLEAQGATARRWEIPPPDRLHPEAEWGYAPELTSDVLRFADRHGYRVERLRFDEPEHLSPWVASLYRNQVLQECGAPDRLLIEPFFLVDPWCVYRTGSVPFWVAFNAHQSFRAVDEYLSREPPFEDIRAILFSNGVRAANTASVEQWRALLDRSRAGGGFLGVNTKDYPEDFAVLFRYHEAIEKLPPAPRPPKPLTWPDIQQHAALNNHLHPVQLEWLNG